MNLILAGLATGVASIPHCFAMCGPLATFACAGHYDKKATVRYQAGRSLSYALLGALVGTAGQLIVDLLKSPWIESMFSWSIAVVLALSALRLARPFSLKTKPPLIALRKSKTTPSVLTRIVRIKPLAPGMLGFLSVLLPCGSLATAGLIAASTASPMYGALTMFAFAITSGLALWSLGWITSHMKFNGTHSARRALAISLGIGAIIFALRPIPISHGSDAMCGAASAQTLASFTSAF